MQTLINLLDGPTEFVTRLDYLHDQNITYIGNEPAFLTVFQYHYAGRPAKSTSRVRTYIPDYFSPTPAGLPGNDDSGAMGSFVAMAMMGLFPNPGQDVYLLTVPFFETVSIVSPLTGKTAIVRTANWEEFNTPNATGGAVGGNGFIQSATVDGKPWTRLDQDCRSKTKPYPSLGRTGQSYRTALEVQLKKSLDTASEFVGLSNLVRGLLYCMSHNAIAPY